MSIKPEASDQKAIGNPKCAAIEKTPELVILDFDGVVVDSEVISLSTLQQALADFGVTLEFDEIRERFLGIAIDKIAEFLDGRLPKMAVNDFSQHWYALLFARFRSDLKVMPGIISFLDHLDQCEILHCIASSGSSERLRVALTATGLSKRFDKRVFSAELVNHGKPAPDLFLLAAEKMDVSAENCLVIEDSPVGIVAAKSAGMRVFGFVGGSHLTNFVDQHLAILRQHKADEIIFQIDTLPNYIRQPRQP